MPTALRYWILNVFASPSGGGNQLAVVESLGRLDSAAMQAIASDFNFSETTFVDRAPGSPLGVPVRIFTLRRELPFAGHPVLGTAHIVHHLHQGKPPDLVSLALGVGEIPVRFFGEGGRPPEMTQRAPEFGADFPKEQAAGLLCLSPGCVSSELSPAFVSTGARFLLVPLATPADVAAARVEPNLYEQFAREHDTLGIGVFAPQTKDFASVVCRVFAPGAGVPEDPATGSHAGCLGALLARGLGWTAERSVVIDQGVEMGRPSKLYVAVAAGAAPRVGGFSTLWAEGHLHV